MFKHYKEEEHFDTSKEDKIAALNREIIGITIALFLLLAIIGVVVYYFKYYKSKTVAKAEHKKIGGVQHYDKKTGKYYYTGEGGHLTI
jgi:flagellar biogenesis protein FliO